MANFVVYDDDGHTYAYEKGEYFRQEMSAKHSGTSTEIALIAATGTYRAAVSELRVASASGERERDQRRHGSEKIRFGKRVPVGK